MEGLPRAALPHVESMVLRLLSSPFGSPWLSPGLAQERIEVVTTTTDLRSLTEAVGGDRVAAISLVPANFDAEDYQPKPQDVLRLKNARMLVRVGLDYDLWFDRLLAQAGKPRNPPRRSRLCRRFLCHRRAGGARDERRPWRRSCAWQRQPALLARPEECRNHHRHILEALARIDPANAADYEANRLAFLARLHDEAGRMGSESWRR